jgi:uncharacterized protein YndB with AHSA1/START domain
MARTDTASRVIVAPLDRVFAALVDPEALTTWLPPDGMSGRFERFDARPGGSYRLVLTYADASRARGKATADSDTVDIRADDVPAGISAKDHAAGLASSLANLATYSSNNGSGHDRGAGLGTRR